MTILIVAFGCIEYTTAVAGFLASWEDEYAKVMHEGTCIFKDLHCYLPHCTLSVAEHA
jgi:hypothetical protein